MQQAWANRGPFVQTHWDTVCKHISLNIIIAQLLPVPRSFQAHCWEKEKKKRQKSQVEKVHLFTSAVSPSQAPPPAVQGGGERRLGRVEVDEIIISERPR